MNKTLTDITIHRWKATITYWPILNMEPKRYAIEEIEDLHDIVERGGSFYGIKGISIELADVPSETELREILGDHAE